MATGVGLIFLILGLMLYGICLLVVNTETRKKISFEFWTVNVWLVSFIPLSLLFNLLFSHSLAPYPFRLSSIFYTLLFWVVYIGGCGFISYWLRKKVCNGS